MTDPRQLPLQIPSQELKDLWQKIGSETRLETLLKDFYRRLAEDVMLGFFFVGKDVTEIALKQKQFLLRAFGVTPSYSGKAPAQAHNSLAPILPGQFDRRLQILEQTLRDHSLDSKAIQTWLSFENAFRSSIVSRDKATTG